MRHLIIGTIAALLAALLVYGVYVVQLREVRLQETIKVVVPSKFIPVGSTIDVGMLKTMSVPKSAYRNGMYTATEEVIGLDALAPLGEHEPILDWKLGQYHLLPRDNQATFQIPKQYVLAVSSSIRAGDQVSIYISEPNGVSHRLIPRLVTVASLKTAANMEVDDVNNSGLWSQTNNDRDKLYASRRNANGALDHLNLNLQEEEWLTIDKLCSSGDRKLVIAFVASSLDPEKIQTTTEGRNL